MKGFGVALVAGLVVILLVVIVLGWFGPGQDELRAEQTEIKREHAVELAPLWLAVKRVLISALGVAAGSIAVILASGALISLLAIPDAKRYARIRSWQIRPMRHGALYPTLAAPDGSGHIKVLDPVNEGGAQKVAALTTGLQPDVKLLGSAARAALRNDPNETMMPEPETIQPPLPEKLLIYGAPLSDQLHLPIGHDGHGPVQLPLRDLGSGIVGGLPKMGKSECVGSMMAGLLRQDATGQRIQLAVSDLKGGLDFGRMPENLAGLAWPVAKSPEEAVALVNNVWEEVERRQKLLERAGAARVEVYNQRSGVEPLPYLFLVIDELAMITMAAEERGMDRATRQQSAEFNGRAVRIVSVGRALGISMIGATQKPSGAVIPTQLRDMCGFRIAFRCMTSDASKAVLGVSGAEELPEERGLALFLGDQAQPRRIRTYLAVIDGGRFDRFVRGLPRRERVRLARPDEALQLPADAEADGLGDEDQPDSPGVVIVNPGSSTTGSATVVEEEAEMPAFWRPATTGSATVLAATTGRLPMEERVKRIRRDRVPNQVEEQETIYEMWLSLDRNSAATQRAIYDYAGGKAFYFVAYAINRALARRGQGPAYKEQER